MILLLFTPSLFVVLAGSATLGILGPSATVGVSSLGSATIGVSGASATVGVRG